ncbi:hypothetical protein TNCV_4033131 [Trichonephila clavipes]|nr:hypothetical protein TNCV_4033131 [Trichonephila clavipes]
MASKKQWGHGGQRCADEPSGAGAFEKEQRERLLGPRQYDANEFEGRVQTFVGRPIRNGEERVVHPPLEFKRIILW